MSDFVIWSWTHHQWWAPNGEGYTADVRTSGHYSRQEAGDIVTAHTYPPGHLVVIPAAVAHKFDPPPVMGRAQ